MKKIISMLLIAAMTIGSSLVATATGEPTLELIPVKLTAESEYGETANEYDIYRIPVTIKNIGLSMKKTTQTVMGSTKEYFYGTSIETAFCKPMMIEVNGNRDESWTMAPYDTILRNSKTENDWGGADGMSATFQTEVSTSPKYPVITTEGISDTEQVINTIDLFYVEIWLMKGETAKISFNDTSVAIATINKNVVDDTSRKTLTFDKQVVTLGGTQATTYTVTFKDYDGTVIGEPQTVEEGKGATAPADPTRDGYTFAGWDVAFDNITADTVVTATYTENAPAVEEITIDSTKSLYLSREAVEIIPDEAATKDIEVEISNESLADSPKTFTIYKSYWTNNQISGSGKVKFTIGVVAQTDIATPFQIRLK